MSHEETVATHSIRPKVRRIKIRKSFMWFVAKLFEIQVVNIGGSINKLLTFFLDFFVQVINVDRWIRRCFHLLARFCAIW